MVTNIYFFTATILHWKKILKEDKYKDIILDSLRFLVVNKRVKVYAFVIMPNHIHLIWKILEPNILSDVQRDFLKFTAQQIKFEIQKTNPELLEFFRVNSKDREFQIWERNPLSVELVTEPVFMQKLNYIHGNPIQSGWKLCDDFIDYRYSSAAFYFMDKDEWTFLTHYADNP